MITKEQIDFNLEDLFHIYDLEKLSEGEISNVEDIIVDFFNKAKLGINFNSNYKVAHINLDTGEMAILCSNSQVAANRADKLSKLNYQCTCMYQLGYHWVFVHHLFPKLERKGE